MVLDVTALTLFNHRSFDPDHRCLAPRAGVAWRLSRPSIGESLGCSTSCPKTRIRRRNASSRFWAVGRGGTIQKAPLNTRSMVLLDKHYSASCVRSLAIVRKNVSYLHWSRHLIGNGFFPFTANCQSASKSSRCISIQGTTSVCFFRGNSPARTDQSSIENTATCLSL